MKFRKPLQKMLYFILSFMVITAQMTGMYVKKAEAQTNDTSTNRKYVWISNKWKTDQYLFDDGNGYVAYGSAISSDYKYQWVIEDSDGHQRIKNRATGNYISSKDIVVAEDAWSKHVQCTSTADIDTQWDVVTAPDAAYKLFKSVKNSSGNYILHVEAQLGYGECSYVDPSWGSPQWKLTEVPDESYVRIRNQYKNDEYLFEDQTGAVYYGHATIDDQRYQWTVEKFNGHERIKNRATGHYITTNGVTDWQSKLPCLDGGTSPNALWDMNSAPDNPTNGPDYKVFKSVDKSLYMHVEAQLGYAECSEGPQPSWGSAKWELVDALLPVPEVVKPTPYVRITNYFRGMFLYEEEGKVKYGNVSSSDMRSQWIVVDKNGNTVEDLNGERKIKNRATGDFINIAAHKDNMEAVKCTAVGDGLTGDTWSISDAINSGFKTITNIAENKDKNYLHIENKLGVLQWSEIPANWGTPQWKFVPYYDSDLSDYTKNYFYMKDHWKGSYLYEEVDSSNSNMGVAKYGNRPDSKNLNAQWVLVKKDDNWRIMNRGTGHFLEAEDVHNIQDPLTCSGTIPESWTSSQWKIALAPDDAGKEAYRIIENAYKTDQYIHVSDQTGSAQCSNMKDATGWWSVQWMFEPAGARQINVPDGYVRFKNNQTGAYLYENSSGVLLYGNPEEKDSASHWKLDNYNGDLKIKNKYTGHYISIKKNSSYITCSDLDDEATCDQWKIEQSPTEGYYNIRSVEQGNGLINVQDSLGFPQSYLISNDMPSCQWGVETAPSTSVDPSSDSVGEENSTRAFDESNYILIKSLVNGKHLYDNNGKLEYDKLKGNELNAQWMIEDFNGHKRIRNRETGNYINFDKDKSSVTIKDSKALSTSVEWNIAEKSGYYYINSTVSKDKYISVDDKENSITMGTLNGNARFSFDKVPSDTRYEAEKAFTSSDISVKNTLSGFSGTGYIEPLSKIGSKVVYTINAQEAKSYTVNIRYSNISKAKGNLNIYVNGIEVDKAQFESTSSEVHWAIVSKKLDLRSGINTIELERDETDASNINMDCIVVKDSISTSYRGATLPYVEYEAEDASTNGTILDDSRTYKELTSEASGRKAVKLDSTGEYIEFTLIKPANSIVLRYSIPDSVDGKGITAPINMYVNGEYKKALTLTSKYSWIYGSYPFNNNPADQNAHRFFDEMHVMTGDLPAGSKIRLQKDANCNADFYVLDFAEMEEVASELAQPKNFLSITDFGAIPNDSKDDTKALEACIKSAKEKGYGVWIPSGTFDLIDVPTEISNVTLRGVGMWYSVLKGKGAAFKLKGDNCKFYDFAMIGDTSVRDDSAPETAFEDNGGIGSVIQNVWVEHMKCGAWLNSPTDGLHIVNSRIRNTFADGINLCNSTKNTTIEQCQIRYTGDDAIAIWSAKDRQADVPCSNNIVKFNTVQLPALANNIAVYGGADNKIQDNILLDTISFGAGINISSNFTPVPFSGTTSVERNTLIRCGGHEYNWNVDYGAIWINCAGQDINGKIKFSDNNLLDSSNQGVSIHGPAKIDSISFDNTVIDKTGTWGINFTGDSKGSVEFNNLIVRDAKIGNLFNGAGVNFSYKINKLSSPILNKVISILNKSENKDITKLPYVIKGISKAGTKVSLLIGDKSVDIKPDSDGTWNYELTEITNGNYIIKALAKNEKDEVLGQDQSEININVGNSNPNQGNGQQPGSNGSEGGLQPSDGGSSSNGSQPSSGEHNQTDPKPQGNSNSKPNTDTQNEKDAIPKTGSIVTVEFLISLGLILIFAGIVLTKNKKTASK
ncbi:carbohydrate-binding protein [Clostridium sp. YIM B02505]|uniref:Carbohydrate-binding protein n=1 Tax=Clostridium yunnanense TaxID=2800325 RepID=A0ABS1ER10_9CLOT|nr:CBM35 domain-containing protein [Clostridium yunnanense]MBK1811743.1 carbohydrate-binding protein [Clostridium yunnanense]